LYICIFVYLYICIFVYLYICISAYLNICIFAYFQKCSANEQYAFCQEGVSENRNWYEASQGFLSWMSVGRLS
jgi:hypothetical protein